MYYLKTLGELALYRDRHASEPLLVNVKPLILVALLATRSDYTAGRDEVAVLLWPDSDRRRSLRSLRQALFYISTYVDEDIVLTDEVARTLSMSPERLAVDIWDFEAAVNADDFARLIDLYDGRFLAGLEDKAGAEVEHWIEAENSRLKVALEVAYSQLIDDALAGGDAKRATELSRAYAGLNPLDEIAQMKLLRTLRATGDDVAALQAYRAYETLVASALDESPPKELQESMARVRRELLEYTGEEPPAEAPVPEAVASEMEPQAEEQSTGKQQLAPRPPARRLSLRWALVVALTIAGLLLALQVVLMLTPFGSSPLNGARALAVALAADEGGDTEVVQITFEGESLSVDPRPELSPEDVISSDGRLVAFTLPATDGWNVAVREVRGNADTLVLTSRAGDEYPLAWSPDGSRVLYATHDLGGQGRDPSYGLSVYRLDTQEHESLPALRSSSLPAAAWSPRGTALAVSVRGYGQSGIYLMDPDGLNLSLIDGSSRDCGRPSWSPEGRSLAFVCAHDSRDQLYTAGADGSGVRAHRTRVGPLGRPLWVFPTMLIFIRDERRGVLTALDTETGKTRRIRTKRGILSLLDIVRPQAQSAWIETVSLQPPIQRVSPGQHVRFKLLSLNAVGDTLPTPRARWSVAGAQFAESLADGLFKIAETGYGAVVASVSGWRVDTLELTSVPLRREDSISPDFREDWGVSSLEERWTNFGTPPPTVTMLSEVSPPTPALVNNGDAHFESGVVSAEAFSLAAGFTLETRGRVRFTGHPNQEWGVGLYSEFHIDSLALGVGQPLLELRLRGPSSIGTGSAMVRAGEYVDSIPLPNDPGNWSTYALQVHADGTCDVIIDGRLYWRAPVRVAVESLGRTHIVLGYRSFQTDIIHGPVSAYLQPTHHIDAD